MLLGVEMNGTRPAADRRPTRSQISYLAIDANGKVKGGTTDSMAMTNLRPETKARIEQTGLRILNRVDLPPGRYQIRFGAHDSAGGNVGSVLYDLEVPDFQKSVVQHQRPRHHQRVGGAAADGPARRAAASGAADAAGRASARSRRTTRSSCSPRSTTTRARRRTKSTSPRR